MLSALCLLLAVPIVAVATDAAAAGVDEVEALLVEAGSVKTSDVARFQQLLGELDTRAGDATPEQRHRLQILRAYRHALLGESGPAVELLGGVLGESRVPDIRFEAGGLLSNIHAANRRFEDSLRILEEILPLVDRIKDLETRHRGLLNAGVVYNQVGEYRIGRQLAQAVVDSHPDPRNACAAENLVAEASLGLEEDVGEPRLRANIAHCDALNERVFAAFARAHLARWLAASDRVDQAIRLLEGYLATVEDTRYPFLQGVYHALLAGYRLREGAQAQAEAHAVVAVERTRGIGNIEPLVSAYGTLYRIASQRGDAEATLLAYKAFVDAERRHLNDVKSREMAYQIVRHQSQQQSQQIELLNQKNALLELDQSNTRQRARLWLVVAGLLAFLLATTAYWAFTTKRLQMRLRRLAELDPLTGVSNRHHFSEKAGCVLASCKQDHRVVALLTFDLDHFKQVNDRYGHAAGDWVLQQVAKACAELCGPGDCIGRLGGEEFAMLLPGCDAATGLQLAEDALDRLAAIDTDGRGYEVRIAASFGITDTTLSGYDLTRLMSHGDRAMYAAKRAGRARVAVFDEDNVRTLTPRSGGLDGPAELRLAGDERRTFPA
ncbi:GGDEF domain-containing protein [Luteimonas yindakuii]|uniref:GGDEF domain-containing protein n=1 Tax=Luteimonas yindakuii TaxID=2565782 RepID=UPI0010A2EA06|nr:GGDEF domain-containing protein [Luteimonas yindakuii]QCO67595.1 GGDEF domain-containing protein [Luteimonas yindakuii]